MNLFDLYFNALNKTGILYAITGRTENYPEIIHSDIDIIIAANQFQLFWDFMRSLERDSLYWVQVISHEITAHYCIISISDGVKHQLIKPDVCSDYYRKGVLFLQADYLLANRVYNPKGFYVLAPEKEFVYYLLKKVDKETVDKEQFDHLSSQWNYNPVGCFETVSSFFSIECQEIVRQSFDHSNINYLLEHFVLLKKGLRDNLNSNYTDKLLRIQNRIMRFLHPTGLVLAFMGPDGCGKTTIIEGVKTDLTELFRQNRQFHLFPKEGNSDTATIDPHASKPRGYFSSVVKLFYFLGLYSIGYWQKIYPLKVKSTLVIFDRYYHDLLVDTVRYRHGAGKTWIRIIGFFIPKPDLWILLNAPADVIQLRKSEVTPEETSRQLQSYNELFGKLKNAYIINANQLPDQVIYDVEQVILEHLKRRTTNRYKNY